jgi:hypothetical protein
MHTGSVTTLKPSAVSSMSIDKYSANLLNALAMYQRSGDRFQYEVCISTARQVVWYGMHGSLT